MSPVLSRLLSTVLFALVAAADTAAGQADSAAMSPKVKAWLASCEQGAGRDCLEIAKAYRNRKEGLERDANKAADFYQRACARGWAVACQEFGELMLAGAAEGFGPDSAVALRMLGRGCEIDPTGKAGRTAGLVGGRNRCEAVVGLYQTRRPQTRADSVDAKRAMTQACQAAKNQIACGMLAGGWNAMPDSMALPDSTKQRLAAEVAAAEQRRLDSIAAVAEAARKADSNRRADSLRNVRRPGIDSTTLIRQRALRRTLTDGCTNGKDATSCNALADMWARGQGGPARRSEADRFRVMACQLDPKFCKKP